MPGLDRLIGWQCLDDPSWTEPWLPPHSSSTLQFAASEADLHRVWILTHLMSASGSGEDMGVMGDEDLHRDANDAALLRAVAAGDHRAADVLVRRHVDLVYTCARRQLRNSSLADDVTQAVFLILQRKAAALSGKRVLASWLIVTTRYAARNMNTREDRRRRHEQRAAEAHPVRLPPNTPADYAEVLPILDDAIESLRETDREAVMLRFFQDQSYDQIAKALATTPEAARKRVSRAIDLLRHRLVRRRVVLSAEGIATAIGMSAIGTAPPGLVVSVVAGMTGAAATTATGVAASILKFTTLRIVAAAAVVSATVVTVVGIVVAQTAPTRAVDAITPNAPIVDPASAQNDGGWRARFDDIYGLEAGEVIKHVPPPFVPEREAFVRSLRREERQTGMPAVLWLRTDGTTYSGEFGYGAEGAQRIADVVEHAMGLPLHQYDWFHEQMRRVMPGDWVARRDASQQQLLDGLAEILSKDSPHPYVFRSWDQRDWAYVAQGSPKVREGELTVTIPLKASELRRDVSGSGTLERMLTDLSHATIFWLIDETEPAPGLKLRYALEPNSGPPRGANFERVLYDRFTNALDSVAKQLGISIVQRVRTDTHWDLVQMEPWRVEFERQYSLAAGVALRNLPPPVSPERERHFGAERMTDNADPGIALFQWHGWPQARMRGWGARPIIAWIMQDIAGLRWHQIEVDEALAAIEIPGDWIVRYDSSAEARPNDLAGLINLRTGRPTRVIAREEHRRVVVISNRPEPPMGLGAVGREIMHRNLELPLIDDSWMPLTKPRGGFRRHLLDELSKVTGTPFVEDGMEDQAAQHMWRWIPSAIAEDEEPLDALMAALEEQAGVTAKQETRPIMIWRIEEVNQ